MSIIREVVKGGRANRIPSLGAPKPVLFSAVLLWLSDGALDVESGHLGLSPDSLSNFYSKVGKWIPSLGFSLPDSKVRHVGPTALQGPFHLGVCYLQCPSFCWTINTKPCCHHDLPWGSTTGLILPVNELRTVQRWLQINNDQKCSTLSFEGHYLSI